MTDCGICGRLCTPMADYDVPTCAACDCRFESIDLRASITLMPERTDWRPLFARIRTELAAS